jgi:hypothetical protein
MSNLSRRSLVAGAASLPALAAGGAAAAIEADPAFALIDRYKEANAIFERAFAAEDQATERFQDKYGELGPDAFSKEMREGLAKEVPEVGFHKCRTSTHEQIEKCRAAYPEWEGDVIEALHEELTHQTKVYDETVRPLKLATKDALDKFNDALKAIVQTPPATIKSLATVLAFISTDEVAIENLYMLLGDEGIIKTLAAHTARLARV